MRLDRRLVGLCSHRTLATSMLLSTVICFSHMGESAHAQQDKSLESFQRAIESNLSYDVGTQWQEVRLTDMCNISVTTAHREYGWRSKFRINLSEIDLETSNKKGYDRIILKFLSERYTIIDGTSPGSAINPNHAAMTQAWPQKTQSIKFSIRTTGKSRDEEKSMRDSAYEGISTLVRNCN